MKKPIDIKVTKEGYKKLKEELEKLIKKRPDVLVRMVAAREQGDLSENAGYHAAKEELGYIDRRLRELKLMLRFANVIGEGTSNIVSLGSKVVVDNGTGPIEFAIVGNIEANPSEKKMSDESPIGKALIGKKVGDTVEVEIPDGTVTYKVLEIKAS